MPKKIEIIGSWRRCEYVIEEQNGVPIIVSVSKSKINYYNPMEISPLFVQPDEAEIHYENSPHLALLHLDTRNQNSILEFVNSWGLLGLRYIEKYSRCENLPYEKDIVPGLKPGQIPNRNHIPMFSIWYEDFTKKNFYKMQEPLPVFIEAVQFYQDICNTLLKGNNFVAEQKLAYFLEGASPTIYWVEAEEGKKNSKVKHGWHSGWKFRSLLEAMYLKFSLDLNAGAIRECKRKDCHNYFVQSGYNPEYCSSKCKMKHNNNNSKITKKREQLYLEFPKIDNAIIDQLIDKSLEMADNNLRNWRKQLKFLEVKEVEG